MHIEIPAGSTVGDLKAILELRAELEDILLVVNGRTSEVGQSLKDGDEVHFIPAISGGANSLAATTILTTDTERA
jgi:molybdopterin converting factor small subunit